MYLCLQFYWVIFVYYLLVNWYYSMDDINNSRMVPHVQGFHVVYLIRFLCSYGILFCLYKHILIKICLHIRVSDCEWKTSLVVYYISSLQLCHAQCLSCYTILIFMSISFFHAYIRIKNLQLVYSYVLCATFLVICLISFSLFSISIAYEFKKVPRDPYLLPWSWTLLT